LGRGKEGLQRRKARVIYRGQQLSSWWSRLMEIKSGEALYCGASPAEETAGGRRWPRADGWVPLSVREGEGAGYRFGEERRWAAGLFREWAKWFPPRPFSIFLFFSLFPFSDSLILF
jgi:hypothetical protein